MTELQATKPTTPSPYAAERRFAIEAVVAAAKLTKAVRDDFDPQAEAVSKARQSVQQELRIKLEGLRLETEESSQDEQAVVGAEHALYVARGLVFAEYAVRNKGLVAECP